MESAPGRRHASFAPGATVARPLRRQLLAPAGGGRGTPRAGADIQADEQTSGGRAFARESWLQRSARDGRGRCRRAGRRCRDLRHQRRLSPADALPGAQLRDRRGAPAPGRHLGPVPLSRRALGQRHAYPRLLVPTLDAREVDRRWPDDPRLPAGDGARIRHRPQDPLRPAGGAGGLVVRGGALDGAVARRSERRPLDLALRLPLRLQRLLRLREGLSAGLSRAGALRRAHRPPAALAAGPGPCRQAHRGDRQRRHRSDPGAGAGAEGRPRDDAAALAELDRVAAVREPDQPLAAALAAAALRAVADALEERAGGDPAVPAGRG